jgi:hypothetical protein
MRKTAGLRQKSGDLAAVGGRGGVALPAGVDRIRAGDAADAQIEAQTYGEAVSLREGMAQTLQDPGQ